MYTCTYVTRLVHTLSAGAPQPHLVCAEVRDSAPGGVACVRRTELCVYIPPPTAPSLTPSTRATPGRTSTYLPAEPPLAEPCVVMGDGLGGCIASMTCVYKSWQRAAMQRGA